MNKKFIALLSIFSFLIISLTLDGQIKKPPLNISATKGFIKLRGYIQYVTRDIKGRHNSYKYKFTLDTTKSSPNKIVEAQINNTKLAHIGNKYSGSIVHSLKTGHLLELKVGVTTKIPSLKPVKYLVIATLTVPNLQSGYTFPAPDSEIVISGNPILIFKWRFSQKIEKTKFNLSNSDTHNHVFGRNVSNDYLDVQRSYLNPGTNYSIWQMTFPVRFQLSRETSINSKLDFHSAYAIHFRTK